MSAPWLPGPTDAPNARRPGGPAGIARRRRRACANRAALACRQLQTALARRRARHCQAPSGDAELTRWADELRAHRNRARALWEPAHGR